MITLERLFDAVPATLYEAWTNPVVMAKWFFVEAHWSAEVNNDVRVGGEYTLSMVLDDETRHTMHGRYLDLEPNRLVRFTWTSHVAENTVVTVEFEPRGEKTLLRLTHELVPTEEGRMQHRHGWGGVLENLATWVGK